MAWPLLACGADLVRGVGIIKVSGVKKRFSGKYTTAGHGFGVPQNPPQRGRGIMFRECLQISQMG